MSRKRVPLQSVLVGKKTLSERAEAIEKMALDRWIAEQDQQDPKFIDEGLTFENVNPDLIMVDEAQNFKNLWPVRPIEGGMPKYLGAIADGAIAVLRAGGSGVPCQESARRRRGDVSLSHSGQELSA
jgi:hypothetical protein